MQKNDIKHENYHCLPAPHNNKQETNQMRTSKKYLSRAAYSKNVSHHCLSLAETQRQVEDLETLYLRKGKVLDVTLLEAVCIGKL